MKKLLQAAVAFVATMLLLWLGLFFMDYSRITSDPTLSEGQKDLIYTVSQSTEGNKTTKKGLGYSVVYETNNDGSFYRTDIYLLGKRVWSAIS